MATTSKLAYGHAVNHLFSFAAGRCLTRALLQEWKAGMEGLAPSSIDVRLSAVRKLIAEARRNGMLAVEQAASLTDIPNVRQQGTRLGNWLTREQAKELLAVPDRSTLKGKREYVLLALLVGCALRRRELAALRATLSWWPRSRALRNTNVTSASTRTMTLAQEALCSVDRPVTCNSSHRI